MTANIAITGGKFAVFTAGQAAWHGLGQNVEEAQTWEQAIELAGLNWTVSKQRLAALADHVNGKDVYTEIDAYGIFRDDVADAADSFLGTCGKSYEPIQNQTAFDFIDVLLEAENGAHYDSAGALGKGERFWASARVPFDFEIGNADAHQTYLLFASSHDSSLSAICKLVTERVVCQNTLTVALGQRSAQFKIKHTKEASKRIEAAKKLMQGAQQSAKSLAEKLTLLASRRVDKQTVKEVLDALFPEDKSKKFQTRRENTLSSILDRFEFNDGDAFPEQRGTAFNLLNAVTGYVDHEKAVRVTSGKKETTVEQIRAESSVFGLGDTFKANALELLFEQAKHLPETNKRLLFVGPKTDNILDATLLV